ncbi:MAG: DUF732 domain-containing protein [Actinobacteria bacterium]|nr:DUF732 domain-containing protein [Actinomycetota bacterium]
MQHTDGPTAAWPAYLAVTAAAVLLTGCSPSDNVVATSGVSTGEVPAGVQAAAPGSAPDDMDDPHATLTLTSQQRGYLDAIKAAGVRPSSDLLALSIGSYVCQARAAKQDDEAVWDFVLPLVRSDMRTAGRGSTPSTAGPESPATARLNTPSTTDINAATADYIRVATERLC